MSICCKCAYVFLQFSYDFVNVYDGSSMLNTQIASLTGILPVPVTSTGPDIFLYFVSDDTVTNPGFRVEYDSGKIDGCL